MATGKTKQQTIDELRARLQEMEETLEAIRSGAVDAIVTSGPAGDLVYTLEGADHAYHMMVETMNEGAVTAQLDGTILYGNPRFVQMTGSAPSGVAGRLLHDFVSVFDYPQLNAILQKEGRNCPNMELRLRDSSGADIPVQIAISPIVLSGATALTLVITDLSTQKRYEEIVAAEKLSRSILEQTQEAIAVCIDGCIVRANRALCEICGCVPLMQPFDQIFSLRMPKAETFSIAIPESGKTIKKREVHYQRPDGQIFDLILSAGPIMGQENEVIGTLISLVDITDRKRAEQAVQESEARFRSVLDNSRDVIYRVNVQSGRYEYISPSCTQVIGFSPDELMAQDAESAMMMVHPDDRSVITEAMKNLESTGEAKLEYRQIGKDGNYRWISNSVAVIRDNNGRPLYRSGNIRDITDRKKAENKLRISEESLRQANEQLEQRVQERTADLQNLTEQLEKSRHELRKLASDLVMSEERERKRIAGVLHDEIAQTLAAARMRLDLLQSTPPDQKDKQTLQDVKALLVQSIQETRALMNDVGNPTLFDLGLKAACEAIANRLMERHPVRISCDIPDTHKDLDPDVKTIVFQMVRELLNNIAKHSQAQNARVTIDMEDGHFRVQVADDGVGFDPLTLGAPTDEGGFGLYSIQERLIAVGGSLNIKSARGSGAVVTAVVPAVLD